MCEDFVRILAMVHDDPRHRPDRSDCDYRPGAGALEGFRAGRDFAAWLGLTPLQKSTGGKRKLGAISKRGERTIRRLLILGASAVVRWAGQRGAAPRRARLRSRRLRIGRSRAVCQ